MLQALLPLALTFAPAPADGGALAASGGLELVCPGLVKQFCGASTSPADTGMPTVLGACPGDVTITWSDSIVGARCPAQRFDSILFRTFTVVDACGSTASCTQQIDIVKPVIVLDLHPRSCPNPFGRNGANGVYPAAILGTPALDVTQIDPMSLQLWVGACAGGPVAPLRFDYEDVSAPYTGGDDCGCTTAGPDGRLDLTFKFDKRKMRDDLGLNAYPSFSFVRLFITGRLTNGCEFIGTDCIRVQ
jgi:hypothetical protein